MGLGMLAGATYHEMMRMAMNAGRVQAHHFWMRNCFIDFWVRGEFVDTCSLTFVFSFGLLIPSIVAELMSFVQLAGFGVLVILKFGMDYGVLLVTRIEIIGFWCRGF